MPHPPLPPLDPAHCPLCGRSNQCAAEAGADPATCWCMTAPIAPAALAALPPAQRGRACLCPACAAAPGPADPPADAPI
ncbi:cysteine-rich CWC family protein [Paracidovorax wautersii]|uniref:cysteine-rich CWC family protein n=1 Tax=Paracidovorax wautersii TaxID=1177982 RepID=UPI00286A60A5|nr:cysteine-rich CWC family protein [Paracidovorax wautersii]